MTSFRVRADVRVEVLDSTVLVLDRVSSRVYELTGSEAEAFRLVEAGISEVPVGLETAMAALVQLGLVEASGWDRRRVLLAGGMAAAAGVVALALPNAAAAQSAPGGGGGGGGVGPLPIPRLLAVNFPTRQIDTVNDVGGIPATPPARSKVAEVPGIVQAGDGISLAGVTPRSFREVDASGVPTVPARYLQYIAARNQLEFGTVPTDAAAASAFRKNATFDAVAPLAAGSGDRVSFKSLTVANSYIRHSGYVLHVVAFSNVTLYLNDTTFERVVTP